MCSANALPAVKLLLRPEPAQTLSSASHLSSEDRDCLYLTPCDCFLLSLEMMQQPLNSSEMPTYPEEGGSPVCRVPSSREARYLLNHSLLPWVGAELW